MVRRRRKRSLIALVIIAVVVGAVVWGAATLGRPETVRRFQVTASWDADGAAVVHETIDYEFPHKRHGIYRVLPGIGWLATDSVKVTADHTKMYTVEPDVSEMRAELAARGIDPSTASADELTGVRVRIGDPNATVKGDHRYSITYPLNHFWVGDSLAASATPAPTEKPAQGRRIGWNSVGTSWAVPINQADISLVAPWRWENAACDKGSSGSVGGCTVTQSVPGRLELTVKGLAEGEGVTVYATVGAPLAAAPAARPQSTQPLARPWWRVPGVVGLIAALAFLLFGVLVGRLLRYLGRDWVMAGPANTGSATDAAFDTSGVKKGSRGGIPAGSRSVDDAKLADWVGTEFAPPQGLEAWQGGVLVAERIRDEHKVAWLLGAAAAGEIALEESENGKIQMERGQKGDESSPYATLLEIAFNRRERVPLGAYDPDFSVMWVSMNSAQLKWLASSPLIDHRAESRVVKVQSLGFLACILAALPGIIAAIRMLRLGPMAVGVVIAAAALAGTGVAMLLRSWELFARTPAGTAVWLRVESFRRFLAGSEAEHVRQAAERGVLREYAAWAVALGEADHWNAAVEASGLAPQTPGVSSSQLMTSLIGACVAASLAPNNVGGGGSSSGSDSSSSFSSSSSGVGGGGGGGGGGSW